MITHDTNNDELPNWREEALFLWQDGHRLQQELNNNPLAATRAATYLRKSGGLPNSYTADGIEGKPFSYRGL